MRIPKPCLSVRTPRKENHLRFVNISPTLVIDTSMERSSRVLHHEKSKKIDCPFKKNAYLSVSAVMFCKQFLACAVHIDRSAFLCNP